MDGFDFSDIDAAMKSKGLEPKERWNYIREGYVAEMTKDDVMARGSADILTKSIVLLQTGWFVLQFLARVASHLPITELEVATIGFAILNFIIYVLWWNKPYNMDRKISFKPNWEKIEAEAKLHGTLCDTCREKLRPPRRQEDASDAVVQKSHQAPEDLPGRFHPIYKLVLAWMHKPYQLLATLVNEGVERLGKTLAPVHVPLIVIGMAFGGIHCVAWSFQFPSSIERDLWRVCSLISVAVPAVPSVLSSLGWEEPLYRILDFDKNSRKNLAVIVLGSVYALSRTILLTIAFSTLRALPLGALKAIQWTTFIPHI